MPRVCAEPGCGKQSTFGTEWKKPVHCTAHKTDAELDVRNSRCIEPGCAKSPSFGTEWNKRLHCFEHKTDGERNVASKRCTDHGCVKRPSFGTVWKNPLHCAEHKTDEERDVLHERCTEPGCNKQPTFGTERGKPVHCTEHAIYGEGDVLHARCTGRDGHPCPEDGRARYGKHCRCCADDDEVKAVRKKTEARCVKRILQILGPLVSAQEQLHVPFGCADFAGKCAYPDVVLDHTNIRIILEIDECRHFAIPESCEMRRMEAVTGELRMRSADERPIAWVRFNPDEGTEPASAKDQLKRCRDAVKAIRDLIESPRDCVVYVNYI